MNRWGWLRRNSKNKAGFTLVEVLVALFVFSISALAITAMTFMSIQSNAMTNQMSQATFLAQDKMEELLSFRNYAEFKTAGLAFSSDNIAGDQSGGGVYTRNWEATCNGAPPPPITDPAPSSCWVNVKVGWKDSKGNHEVDIRSLWRGI
ncbi:MAG: prepilin-type N-terminal cleavage/methylation domain-containing protein [Desulfuromonadales bacterium]|nr:prepilin-type N-terminal cleavage/methylation domain-containing protein [Desulfuromonadales bacterium]